MKVLTAQADSVGVPAASEVPGVRKWRNPAAQTTGLLTRSIPTSPEGGLPAMMMASPEPPVTAPRRCDCADWLRSVAEDHANNSRDFGRGFMHAATELARRCA